MPEPGVDRLSNIERTEREAKAVVDAEVWPTGPLTPREKHFIRLLGEMREDRDRWRDNAQGAVSLTDDEWDRVVWWLSRPVPPSPMKALDEAILHKIAAARGGAVVEPG